MQRLRLGQVLALLGEEEIERIIISDLKSYTFFCAIKALMDKTKRKDPMHLGEDAHRAVLEEMASFEEYLKATYGRGFAYGALVQSEKLPLPVVEDVAEEAATFPPVSE